MNAVADRLVCSVAPVEAILRVAAQLPVFPCRRSPEEVTVRGEKKLAKAKSPLTTNGLLDASQDPARIRAWWQRWPDALVGVPTGTTTKLVVVDYDAHKADESANDWIVENTESLLATRTHGTLNGGRHYLFRAPPDVEYRNGVCLTLGGIKRGGIDLRAQGGYVIWWPLHGGSAVGEISPLPAGLVDTQKIEAVELPALSASSPQKWAKDRGLVADALAYLDPSEYDLWSRAGMAIHLASNASDDGFELWHSWSSGGITGELPSNYSGINDCRYHWASYRHDKDRSKMVTLGSIFEAAKTKGYVIPARQWQEESSMIVTRDAPEFDIDPNEHLFDLSGADGRKILSDYERRFSKFGTTPFDPEGDRLRLYPGGVTIWSGFPGAGKTTLLRQLACHCLMRGSSVFFASLEEDPRSVLIGLASVAAGQEMTDSDKLQWFMDWYADRFRLWGVIGIAQHRQLLAVIRKLATQGIKHAIIDSLMCLDVANDDFEAQRKFANLVAATARAANIHIHLVAHPRKLISTEQEPDINDVAGAREIGGIADNVIFVRRATNEGADPNASSTPMCIAIRKQRHGRGTLGNIAGWYHRDWRQFSVEQFPLGPTRYLPNEAYDK